jgi:TRAP-type C4-dicarboxylate transport system permease small subunit
MTILVRLAARLCRLLSLVAAAAVLAMMLHICLDVVLRNLFRYSMNSAPEVVARYYMVAIAFLPLGWLHIRDEMISVELLDAFLPALARRVQTLLVALAGAGIYGTLVWVTGRKALSEMRTGTMVEIGTSKLPVWHSYFLPPAGFALATLACLLVALVALRPSLAPEMPKAAQ